jgi:aliphatic nitrilase
MASEAGPLRVAAVQASPVFLDAAATTDKAVRLIEEAAGRDARLIVFGEGFLPGHPIWLHVLPVTSPRQIELAGELVRSAISIPGPETERLADVSRRTGAMIVLGATERLAAGRSSIAASVIAIGPDGTVSVRRKLVPAVGERVLFTAGAGEDIRAFDSPWGPIGALLGGENSNPLLTWTLRELGARIHVAMWPPHFNKPGVMAETATITSRAIAYQNSAHVISVAGATTPEIRARIAQTDADRALLDAMAADPASSVYAPRGALAAGPLDGGDGILYADLDLGAGAWPSLVNRQYDRPDLFHVSVDRSAQPSSLTFGRPRDVASPAGPDMTDVEGRARRLIDERYGKLLSAQDADRLVPFVVNILRTSEALETAVPGDMDPDSVLYADDPRTEP